MKTIVPLAVVALAACSTRPYDPDRPEPGTMLIRDLDPVRQQRENDCGPACLTTVLRAWDQAVTLDELVKACPPREGGGVTAAALRAEAKKRGLKAFAIEGTLDDVEEHLAKGRPLIVGLVKRDLFGSRAHYEVVAGLAQDRSYLVLIDPARGWMRESKKAFLREWESSGRVLLLIAK